jgi:hypothetical protein
MLSCYPGVSLERLRKTRNNFSQFKQQRDLDLKTGHLKHKAIFPGMKLLNTSKNTCWATSLPPDLNESALRRLLCKHEGDT